eukprot:5735667-Prymnesium_polylepis.1
MGRWHLWQLGVARYDERGVQLVQGHGYWLGHVHRLVAHHADCADHVRALPVPNPHPLLPPTPQSSHIRAAMHPTLLARGRTDLQRATAYGDINCQKLFGFTTSVFGCLSGLGSMVTFANSCWKDLPDTITFNDSTCGATRVCPREGGAYGPRRNSFQTRRQRSFACDARRCACPVWPQHHRRLGSRCGLHVDARCGHPQGHRR